MLAGPGQYVIMMGVCPDQLLLSRVLLPPAATCTYIGPHTGMYPTFGDYCRTLGAVVNASGDAATPGTLSYRLVRVQHAICLGC